MWLMLADYSYREIPSFGRDTIRRFPGNCSEMKRMAARDFEDLLQVRVICVRPKSHSTDNIPVRHSCF
jgi:hypothetical protein